MRFASKLAVLSGADRYAFKVDRAADLDLTRELVKTERGDRCSERRRFVWIIRIPGRLSRRSTLAFHTRLARCLAPAFRHPELRNSGRR